METMMFEVSWALFIIASLLLILTPGQDMVLVMSRSLAQGSAAGLATAAGVSVGLVGHSVLATLGLGAILRTSEWLFVALKLFGAAYLVYLGLTLVRARVSDLVLERSSHRSLSKLFWDGALSNASNPKIAIFYFAFLPQFVLPNSQHPTLSVLFLGLIFAALTFLVKAPVGYFAGLLSAWLRARPNVLLWVYRSSGLVLIALAVNLALERRN
jgi:threonine/homoserine/homoserine lactone efflux protein